MTVIEKSGEILTVIEILTLNQCGSIFQPFFTWRQKNIDKALKIQRQNFDCARWERHIHFVTHAKMENKIFIINIYLFVPKT